MEIQEQPFKGGDINSYNDGPTDNGLQFGPLYELEVSSPAPFLEPDEDIIHIQQTYHLEGSDETLNIFTQSFLNVTIEKIRGAFRN